MKNSLKLLFLSLLLILLVGCSSSGKAADIINNDGKKEVIYSMDFEIRIIDLLTGKLIK